MNQDSTLGTNKALLWGPCTPQCLACPTPPPPAFKCHCNYSPVSILESWHLKSQENGNVGFKSGDMASTCYAGSSIQWGVRAQASPPGWRQKGREQIQACVPIPSEKTQTAPVVVFSQLLSPWHSLTITRCLEKKGFIMCFSPHYFTGIFLISPIA